MSTAQHTNPTDLTRYDLEIGGMSCASCAARIEKKLNRVDGVHASVNYATEKATIEAAPGIDVDHLIAVVERTGYTAQLPTPTRDNSDDELASLRRRLIVGLIFALPVVAISMVPALQFDHWAWLMLLLASPVMLYSGWPFHRATAVNLRHGALTMDTLITVGTTAAFLWSLIALTLGHAGAAGMTHEFSLRPTRDDGMGDVYFEVVTAVITFVLLGRYLEKRSKRQAGAALRALMTLGAKDVAVLRRGADGTEAEQRIPIEQLTVGDRFIVRPGEKIATDGRVVTGHSAVDASLVTGESIPADVGPDSPVIGATVNVGGRLIIEATRVGEDTQLAQMARMVEDAQSGKAEIQRLADRIAGVFVPIVFGIAALTLAGWLIAGGTLAMAATAAVAVLIIACPCALGLATPTALLVGTGRGAEMGILIKGPEVLESTRRVDTVVLDKTGTVTSGRMSLAAVRVEGGTDDDRARAEEHVLRRAAALEDASEHPIARAIADAGRDRLSALPAVTNFRNHEGLGVSGQIDDTTVLVGRPRFLHDHGLTIPATLETALDEAEARGRTAVVVGWDGQARGLLEIADQVKPTSHEAITRLRELGLTPVLLTGDNATTARSVAESVGIADVISDVLPQEKVDVITRLQGEGRTVAMVGDGVNDAPALATADLGLAMGTGTDAAIAAADITLVRGDLRTAADAIRLSRRTLATIKGNLFWAFAYNTAAIPLAALGFLNPMLAGAAMAFSSVFVVTNSLRLRSFRSSIR